MGVFGGFLGKIVHSEYEFKRHRDYKEGSDVFEIGNGDVLGITNIEKMRLFIKGTNSSDYDIVIKSNYIHFLVCRDIPINKVYPESPLLYRYGAFLKTYEDKYRIVKNGSIEDVDKDTYLKHLVNMENRILELYEQVSPGIRKEIDTHIKFLLEAIKAAKNYLWKNI